MGILLRTRLAWAGSAAVFFILCSPGLRTAAGQEEGARRRFDVAAAFSAAGYYEDEISDGVGGVFSFTYHLPSPLALQATLGIFDTGQAYQLSALWKFRHNKQIVPYLQAGYGFYEGRENTSFSDAVICGAFLLADCSQELDDTHGPHAGVGLKAYFTRNRRWFFDFGYRFLLLKKTDLTVTTDFSVGPSTVTRERVDPDAVLGVLGIGYSF